MFSKTDQIVFYGIDNINESLEKIIKSLGLENELFELKLIMIEAVTNAFIHGNEKDSSKPIIMKWNLEDKFINISVEYNGEYGESLNLKKYIDENNLLLENGRGLFIISSYSDEVKFEDGCIVMKKLL